MERYSCLAGWIDTQRWILRQVRNYGYMTRAHSSPRGRFNRLFLTIKFMSRIKLLPLEKVRSDFIPIKADRVASPLFLIRIPGSQPGIGRLLKMDSGVIPKSIAVADSGSRPLLILRAVL